jgi:hypothetical protein
MLELEVKQKGLHSSRMRSPETDALTEILTHSCRLAMLLMPVLQVKQQELQPFKVRSPETGPLTEILTHSCQLAMFPHARVTDEAARAPIF